MNTILKNAIKTQLFPALKGTRISFVFTKMQKLFPELVEQILVATHFLDSKQTFPTLAERIYCIMHDVHEVVRCKTCQKNEVAFQSYSSGYKPYCSRNCAFASVERTQKIKMTNMRRYGTSCSLWGKSSVEKKKNTFLKNYGVDHPSKSQVIKDKKRKTFQEKYGVDAPGQMEEVKEKSKQTCLKRYGVEYSHQNALVVEKTRQTNLQRFGMEWRLCDTALNRGGINQEKSYQRMLDNEYDFPLFTLEEYKTRKRNDVLLPFKCRTCGTQFESKHRNGIHDRCPMCYPVEHATVSKEEKDLVDYLKGFQMPIIENDRTVLSDRLELDMYLPTKNIAIEYDGLYWHSILQKKEKLYHLKKTEECEAKEIRLIHIFENEWVCKKDIVKSRLKNILGVYDTTVFARKCKVREVPSSKSTEFQEENHIQGAINAKVHLGLFFDDKLISLMTFGKPRFNRNYEWELLRFCNKLGYHIPGSAGKLLRHFERNYKPKSLISYADRRWSRGKLYEALGFKLDHASAPNYWYFMNCSLILEPRQKFQKHKQKNLLTKFDSGKTEIENMLDNKYNLIYDCGNLVYAKQYANENRHDNLDTKSL